MIRFRVEFVDGTRVVILAHTEKEAYTKADKMSNYRISEIWND